MKLAVFSHKYCWRSETSPTGFVTDGGFPLQMEAISELFSSTNIVVPCGNGVQVAGVSALTGTRLKIVPLSVVPGKGISRKLGMPFWLMKNVRIILSEIRQADAVHTPIPGDVGTIGMLFALILRKRLFVRHCGNWLVQRTIAERFWKWAMEYFAGGRNIMLATGGAANPPSLRNPHVRWIFSTSLRSEQVLKSVPRKPPRDGELRIIIACRQEERKGTDKVIASLPLILKRFPKTSLDVVGGGALLDLLKEQVISLGLEERVCFHGQVGQARVADLLRASHIFCYPTSASEGFPKVVLEALSAGLPVITTKVSVLPQLMRSGCGVLLDDTTPAALVNAVKEVCLDGEKYCAMSARAIQTAQQYTLENWRDTIGAALREAWKVTDLSRNN